MRHFIREPRHCSLLPVDIRFPTVCMIQGRNFRKPDRSGFPGPASNLLVRRSKAGLSEAPARAGASLVQASRPPVPCLMSCSDTARTGSIVFDYQSTTENSLDICSGPPIIENNSHL